MDEIAQSIVSDLEPREGWWKSSTEGTILEAAENLLSEGCDEEVVRESLEGIISAMRDEYGD
jgi:hypothetical protein